jgi:hypothetical protein
MRRKHPNWTVLLMQSIGLSLDASRVVAYRLAKLGRGGARANVESRRMVEEKIKAALDAGRAATCSIMTGKGHLAQKRVLNVYRKRVRANLARLKK